MGHSRFFSTLLVSTTILLIAFSATAGSPLRKGASAPSFTRRDLGGKIWRLSDLTGPKCMLPATERKILLLYFFATYCDPCKEKIPLIEKLARDYGPRNLEVLYISNESRSELTRFKNRESFPFKILHDSGAIMTGDYGVSFIPTIIMVDSKAKVRLVSIGNGANLDKLLREHLDEISPPTSGN
jgi:cytochrome c biogenesis protein CcmG, thiol:disulfide interchange protein DsbE